MPEEPSGPARTPATRPRPGRGRTSLPGAPRRTDSRRPWWERPRAAACHSAENLERGRTLQQHRALAGVAGQCRGTFVLGARLVDAVEPASRSARTLGSRREGGVADVADLPGTDEVGERAEGVVRVDSWVVAGSRLLCSNWRTSSAWRQRPAGPFVKTANPSGHVALPAPARPEDPPGEEVADQPAHEPDVRAGAPSTYGAIFVCAGDARLWVAPRVDHDR
jgi:hypothetical protein